MNKFEVNENGGWIVPVRTVFSFSLEFPAFSEFGIGCKFVSDCIFGDSCAFGNFCGFGEGCKFGNFCEFSGRCEFANFCGFGEGCKFGEVCKFGEWCKFGDSCAFDKYCRFGPCYKFKGEYLYAGKSVSKMFQMQNIDGSGRLINAIVFKDKEVLIEIGCFSGTPEEFCSKASSEGKLTYAETIATLFNVSI